MPIFARRLTLAPVMSRSRKRTRPAVGGCSPVMTLNSVVLPAPFGPISPVIVPGSAETDASSTAVMPPKRTVTPVTSSNAMAGHLPLGEHIGLGVARTGRRSAPVSARSRGGSGSRGSTSRKPLKSRLTSPLGSRPSMIAPTPMTRKTRPDSDGIVAWMTGSSISRMPPTSAPDTEVTPATTATSRKRQALQRLEVGRRHDAVQPGEQRAGEPGDAGRRAEHRDPEPALVQPERAAGGRAVAQRDEQPADRPAAQRQHAEADGGEHRRP